MEKFLTLRNKKLSQNIYKDVALLYPAFKDLINLVMTQVNHEMTGKTGYQSFVVVETYRSQLRQTELYNQGRSTPGAIVTWRRHSLHSECVACDVYPVKNGKIVTDVPPRDMGVFEFLRHAAHTHGVESGLDWNTQDAGHLQLNLVSRNIHHLEILQWVDKIRIQTRT